MKKRLTLLTLATSITLNASDLTDAPLSLRFPAALSHLSIYGDVSAKSGASAASKWESSPNPANKGWSFPAEYDYRLSGQYNNLSFDNGTELNFTTQTASFDAGELGVLRLGLVQIRSNTAVARGAVPLPYHFELDGAQLSWGRKLGASLALGAEIGFTHGETAFKLPAFDLAHTDKDAWSFRLGSLWHPTDSKWFFGLYGDYVNGTSETQVRVPVFSRSTETVRQWLVHPGIAYEYAENAMIHLDYEASWASNGQVSLAHQRMAFGTDIKLAQFFYLRAGAACDARRNATWSTGLGFYPSKYVFFDLAYQNSAFAELNQEFGRSQTLNVSVSVQW